MSRPVPESLLVLEMYRAKMRRVADKVAAEEGAYLADLEERLVARTIEIAITYVNAHSGRQAEVRS